MPHCTKPEWGKRSTKPLCFSVDPADSHRGWDKNVQET
jgi:hypothetical protein